MRSLGLVLSLVIVSSMAGAAHAQDPATESRAHFTTGVTLYDEGRLAQALAEFREAQRISPSSVVLYNIAQVEAELGHAVESVAAYEELVASARTIEASMRAQIDAALARQRARISTLRVMTNAAGATVALDDVDIGVAPIESLRVSAGEHVVTARANGYESVRYRFIVAGGATEVANLTLTLSGAAIGSLRVDARIPGIDVVVDGVTYGITPLASSIALAAGTHHVEGRRPGYTLFSQDVNVAPASESRTTIVVEPDPAAPDSALGTLRLAIPDASSSLRIDGSAADVASASHLSLPAGLHDVEVHVADREPYTTRVDMLAMETYDLRPPYAWTPEAREVRVAGARTQSTIGWGLAIGGGAVALGGAIALIAVWADYQGGSARIADAFNTHCADYHASWDATAPYTYAHQCAAALDGLYDLGSFTDAHGNPTEPPFANVDRLNNAIGQRLSTYYIEIGIGAAIAAIGGIALVSGIVLVATSSDEPSIDRAARASSFRLELVGGPSSLTLRGAF